MTNVKCPGEEVTRCVLCWYSQKNRPWTLKQDPNLRTLLKFTPFSSDIRQYRENCKFTLDYFTKKHFFEINENIMSNFKKFLDKYPQWNTLLIKDIIFFFVSHYHILCFCILFFCIPIFFNKLLPVTFVTF